MTETAIVARAYYDEDTHVRTPSSTFAFGLPRNWTSHTYVINLLLVPPDDQTAFKRHYPDAQFKGLLTAEGQLMVGDENGAASFPPIGPPMSLQNLKSGPITRVESASQNSAKRFGLRVVSIGGRLVTPGR